MTTKKAKKQPVKKVEEKEESFANMPKEEEKVINEVEYLEEKPELKIEEKEEPKIEDFSNKVTPEFIPESKIEKVKKGDKGLIETTDVKLLKSLKGTKTTTKGVIFIGEPRK